MKKIVYAIAALALIFTGCAKELDNSTKENFSKVRLHVKVADQLTKVSADNDGRYHWQAGDKITVLNSKGDANEFSTVDGGASVNFSTDSFDGDAIGKYAMYPASAGHVEVEDVIGFNLPSSYIWKANSTNMPMLAKIVGDEATFKAVGGVLKLVCYNIPANAVLMEFAATSKQISGEFVIKDGTVETPVITTADKESSNNIVNFDFTGNRDDNMVFYIPLPTGEINGFTVTFYSDAPAALFTKTTTKTLTVSRNQLIIAPALNCSDNIILWRESFSGYNDGDKFSNSDIKTGGSYDAEYYGSATIKYTSADGTGSSSKTTRIYTTDDEYNAADVPEMYVGKTGGYFNVAGIPTNGASSMVLTFYSNNTGISISTTTDGVTIGSITTDGKKRTASISNSKSASSFDLKFAVASSNSRLDDISVEAVGGSSSMPEISFSGASSVTIASGTLNVNINNVSLSNALDASGISIVIDPSSTWISSASIVSGSVLSGDAQLQISAGEYNHSSEPRVGYVYLRATGAVSKTITVTQNPSIVPNPTLTTTPGASTFTITWTGDAKAKNYVGYYSSDGNLADPTTATPLTITNEGTAFSATPSETVTNGTKYYVYVKVNEVADSYASKYATLSTWSTGNVTPSSSSSTVTFTYSSLYSGVSSSQGVDGDSDTVGAITISYSTGTGSNEPKYYKSGSAMRFYNGNTLTNPARSEYLWHKEERLGFSCRPQNC